MVFAVQGFEIALDIGCGRAQKKRSPGLLRQSAGDGPGVVKRRRILLLVSPLVLFVDDDEAEVGERSKKGASRADDDIVSPLGDAAPLVVPLAKGKFAVQNGHP